LQDVLKDCKIDTFNEQGTKKAILQFDEVLAQLKAMDGHATRNMFKWKQDFVDGRLSTTIIGPSSPSSTEVDCPSPTLRPTSLPSSNIGFLKS